LIADNSHSQRTVAGRNVLLEQKTALPGSLAASSMNNEVVEFIRGLNQKYGVPLPAPVKLENKWQAWKLRTSITAFEFGQVWKNFGTWMRYRFFKE